MCDDVTPPENWSDGGWVLGGWWPVWQLLRLSPWLDAWLHNHPLEPLFAGLLLVGLIALGSSPYISYRAYHRQQSYRLLIFGSTLAAGLLAFIASLVWIGIERPIHTPALFGFVLCWAFGVWGVPVGALMGLLCAGHQGWHRLENQQPRR